jgi:putative membrane protein
VHYGYGTAAGGLYGALAEVWPNAKIGFGMGYGIALWLLGSETALPALRLGPPPTDVPPHKHADNLAAHVCYGLTLDFVRRVAKVLI